MIRQPSQAAGASGATGASGTTGASGAAGATGASPAGNPPGPANRPAAQSSNKPTAAKAAAPSQPAASARTAATAASPSGSAASPPKSPTSPSVTGPAAPKPGALPKQKLILGAVAAGVLVLAVALLVWKPWQPAPPRLNSEPLVIARFATSSALDDQPWSMQREYMEILEKKEDALLDAYKGGSLTDQQYRRALQLGWYGKHLEQMDKFFQRPPVQRAAYLDAKVLDKKDIFPNAPKKPKKESDDRSALMAEEVDRDDSTEEQDIARWPADVQQKWAQYRAAVAERKAYYKERHQKAEDAAKTGKKPAADDAAPQPGSGAQPASGTDPASGAQPAAASQQPPEPPADSNR